MMTALPPSPNESRPRVLLVDDDRKLCRLTAEYLQSMGYEVEAVHTGPEGLTRAAEGTFAAIILDVMLPGLDGFEVLKGIRQATDTPLLMLTSRGDEADRIVGLEMGADDYLPKTFSPRELLARLRAITRRAVRRQSQIPETNALTVGTLRIDFHTRTATQEDQLLVLTPVEFDILACLARHPGRIRTREQLLAEIRDRNYEVFDRSIDVHISALRRKLNDDPKNPQFIQTVRSAGYLLLQPGS